MVPGIEVRSPDGIQRSGLAVRVATAAAYAVVMLGAIWVGGLERLGTWGPVIFGAIFGLLAAFSAAEFYALVRRESRLPNEWLGIVVAGSMPVAAALWGMAGLSAVLTALIGGALLWHVSFIRVRTADTAMTILGTVYTGFLLAYMVLILRNFSAGQELAFAVVLSVWANDSLAYLVGSTLGRHKLVPRISPKKSWEGFGAGLVGSVAVWVLFALLRPQSGIALPWAVLTGLAVGVTVVVGDLFESRIKREVGVKDSGTALPGHGGFLDRLDSLILVGLVAYWMLWLGGVR